MGDSDKLGFWILLLTGVGMIVIGIRIRDTGCVLLGGMALAYSVAAVCARIIEK